MDRLGLVVSWHPAQCRPCASPGTEAAEPLQHCTVWGLTLRALGDQKDGDRLADRSAVDDQNHKRRLIGMVSEQFPGVMEMTQVCA